MPLSDATAKEVLKAFAETTNSLNMARLIMKDDDTRDLAGEIVNDSRALIAKATAEMGAK